MEDCLFVIAPRTGGNNLRICGKIFLVPYIIFLDRKNNTIRREVNAT